MEIDSNTSRVVMAGHTVAQSHSSRAWKMTAGASTVRPNGEVCREIRRDGLRDDFMQSDGQAGVDRN